MLMTWQYKYIIKHCIFLNCNYIFWAILWAILSYISCLLMWKPIKFSKVFLHVSHVDYLGACSDVPLWRVSVFGHCSAGCGWHQCLSPACWPVGPACAETRLSIGPGHADTGEGLVGLLCSPPKPGSEGDVLRTTSPARTHREKKKILFYSYIIKHFLIYIGYCSYHNNNCWIRLEWHINIKISNMHSMAQCHFIHVTTKPEGELDWN